MHLGALHVGRSSVVTICGSVGYGSGRFFGYGRRIRVENVSHGSGRVEKVCTRRPLVVTRTHTHTHTHNGPIALPWQLERSPVAARVWWSWSYGNKSSHLSRSRTQHDSTLCRHVVDSQSIYHEITQTHRAILLSSALRLTLILHRLLAVAVSSWAGAASTW